MHINTIMKEDFEYILSKIDLSVIRNKTFFITGCTGMLPSYIAFCLLYANRTKACSIKVIGTYRNHSKAKLLYEDFLQDPFLCLLPIDLHKKIDFNDEIDFIIHGASPATAKDFGLNPVNVILTNVMGTYNLLEWASCKNINSFLFLSTDQIYGELPHNDKISESDIGKLDPLDLRSCYGESKKAGENLCYCYYYKYNLPVKIVRPSHTFGPTLNIREDSRIYAGFIRNILNNEDIVITGDWRNILYFCYLADAVIGFLMVLLYGERGHAYNITNIENKTTIKNLADLLVSIYKEKELKVKIEKSKDVIITNKKMNAGHLDISKIQALGYYPCYNLEESFKRTIQSFSMEEIK